MSAAIPSFGQIKEALLVTPCEPTPACILPLSALDSQPFLRFAIEYLLVYRAHPGLSRGIVSARLKTSLARALVPYYPLAGRVRAKHDGSPGQLEVVCRGQGAAFIEAELMNYSLVDFESAPHYVAEWRDLLSFHVEENGPIVVVQLSWLADGSAALGVGFQHCACDGIGSSEFLNSFAKLARGPGHLEPVPVWERHLLDPLPDKLTRGTFMTHPEFERVQDLCGFTARFAGEHLTPTSTMFTRGEMSELKRKACRLSEFSSYTSFEVISAHVWRCWAKALNMPSNQTLKLLFSINIRNRVNPNLPTGFYGNGFVLGCAQTTVNDLEEKGLEHATRLIRKAKERVDEKYVREVIELVSRNRASPNSVGVLILSQWSRLGLERVDFGLGRPLCVGPICSDKYCLLLPVYNQKNAVRVMVAIPSSAADMYQDLLRQPFVC
ncbi:hypothetical protein Ancab_034501 [Ancistrocladus abbreviatus]